MDQTDSKFFIKREDFAKVVKAIRDLHGRESIEDSSGRHFSWVDHDFYTKNNIMGLTFQKNDISLEM